MLRREGWSGEGAAALVDALATDYREADLDEADRAMLDYVALVTRTPDDVTRAEIERLRGCGFDDRGIHDICSIAAYFAFVNRVADGLGVELESRFGDGGQHRQGSEADGSDQTR